MRRLVLTLLMIAVVPAAAQRRRAPAPAPAPAPTPNVPQLLPLDPNEWETLLKLADPYAEPFADIRAEPPGVAVRPCPANTPPVGAPAPAAPAPAPGQPAPATPPATGTGYCYVSTSVRKSPIYVSVTDEKRLEILKYYVLRYNLYSPISDFTIAMFDPASRVSLPPSNPVKAPGPNVINGYVGRIRNRLYYELDALKKTETATATTFQGERGKVVDSARLANSSMENAYRRQLKMLGLMFVDGPAWHLLLGRQKLL